MSCISDIYRFAHRYPVGPTSCRLQQIGSISDSYHFAQFADMVNFFISDRHRGIVGPICPHSDHLLISIRYGHADWALIYTVFIFSENISRSIGLYIFELI